MVPEAMNRIDFKVLGLGEIVATDTGHLADKESFTSPSRKAFNGLVLLIIKASGKGGLEIKASSKDLNTAVLKIKAQ
ncbi:MAG TPA: hypothetical protein PK191_04420 [Niabella sp.]|nr:hypothetical protein [Niabella sp.]HOZ97820.1 hypothetical protein [Niabella sp.]HQW15659.1 hypothetical protein [Niabella sp.]HQX20824.1 hypothetical protein [Niabella sp.]HQX42074.1 hypothetical protein [Niabella sp.]